MKRLRNFVWWLFHGSERVDAAWVRIEALERQNSKLAAALKVAQDESKDMAEQIDKLRAVVGHEVKDHRPPVRVARNWRDVRAVMGEEAHAF